MKMYLNNITLPEQNDFKEIPDPNYAKNISLDGTLTVDTINNRRVWQVGWDKLTAAEYATLRAKYDSQFTTGSFLSFGVPGIALNVLVFMSINERVMVFTNQYVRNVQVTFEERYAVS